MAGCLQTRSGGGQAWVRKRSSTSMRVPPPIHPAAWNFGGCDICRGLTRWLMAPFRAKAWAQLCTCPGQGWQPKDPCWGRRARCPHSSQTTALRPSMPSPGLVGPVSAGPFTFSTWSVQSRAVPGMQPLLEFTSRFCDGAAPQGVGRTGATLHVSPAKGHLRPRTLGMGGEMARLTVTQALLAPDRCLEPQVPPRGPRNGPGPGQAGRQLGYLGSAPSAHNKRLPTTALVFCSRTPESQAPARAEGRAGTGWGGRPGAQLGPPQGTGWGQPGERAPRGRP